MKVIHVIDSQGFGGAERYIINLCSKMKETTEIDIKIITFYFNEFIDELSKQKNISYIFLCEEINSTNSEFIKRIRNLYTQYPHSIFHTHGYRANFLVRLALFFTKAKIITTIHSTLNYWKNPIKKKIYAFLDKTTSIRNQKIIVVSEYIRDYYQTPFNKKKIVTVYNGVDHKNFKLKKDLAIGESIQFVTVGSLNDVKNHITSIKAFDYIINKKGYQIIKLLIVGDGPNFQELKKYIESRNLGNYVSMTGYTKNVEMYLQLSNVYLSTSIDESFGLSIVEAMLSGLPVISSHVGGIPEIITNEVTGMFYEPPQDYIALSNQIIRLITNPELIAFISKNAYQHALENFTVEIWCNKLVNIYYKL